MKYSRGLKYLLRNDNTYMVQGIGSCRDSDVRIPDAYRNKPVTSIVGWAFAYCRSLTSITIPNGVTRIGSSAFYGCSELKSITIPNSVTSIGDCAFYKCINLKSPKGNYKAFYDSQRLKAKADRYVRFELGAETYCRTGALRCCENGIHYCTNIFDIFNYYFGRLGEDVVIAECEVSDENVGNEGDSKRCARWVKPLRILTNEEVISIMNTFNGGRK